MGSKNTDETPAAKNPPRNLEDHRVAEQRDAEVRRAAEEAQKPENKMRHWLDLLRAAKGVDDQRHVHHQVLSELLQFMLSNLEYRTAPVDPVQDLKEKPNGQ